MELEKLINEDIKQAMIHKDKEKLEALNGQIEGLLKLEVGIDFVGGTMSGDVALYSEFATKADLDFYQVHPKHKAVQAFVTDVRSDRMVVDYEM